MLLANFPETTASVPAVPRLAAQDVLPLPAALADALKFPFSELHEDSREHPAHRGGHVQALFAHGDDLLAVPLAVLVLEGHEVQVVPEPTVQLVDDQDIPLIQELQAQQLPDLRALPDRQAARHV
jgi:hypothetical protein